MKTTTLSVLFLFLFISISSFAQDIQVKGKVSSKIENKKEALFGANIYLKGTSLGTSSDRKGEFTFPRKLKTGDILVVSYLGFIKKQITISTKSTYLDVVLKEDETNIMGALPSKKRYKSKRSKQ